VVGFDGDVFTYSAIVTLTQGTPTSASVADGAGYSGQLTVTNAVGTVTYTETSSTDSTDVVVGSTGAITAGTSLAPRAPGIYSVSGTDHDTNGDTGTWAFALTVNPAIVTLTQGTPTTASVADGAGYSGQLTVTNALRDPHLHRDQLDGLHRRRGRLHRGHHRGHLARAGHLHRLGHRPRHQR
jgi:hypothetical protein